jgi:exodeoxyribonuclease VII small subunit
MKRKEGPALAGTGETSGTGGRAGDDAAASPTFETMMQRLQELVGTLERGNLSLEESIRSFEEGVALVKRCTEILDHAERRIQKLTRDAEGKPAVVPVEEDGEADDDRSDELPF